jgi:UDP-glucose 4-epimerase
MNTILISGGAGFIGSHIAEELIKNNKKVIILDNLSGGSLKNVPDKAKFIKGSITNIKLVERIFKENNIEYVFHTAAYATEGLSHFMRRFNYENNLIGSINLINESIKNNVRCFIFTSSIAVYGSQPVPMKEEMNPMPEDPYGIAKLAVEQDLKAAKKMFGLNYIIFRLHNVYGERQNVNDKYRNVVGIFLKQALSNQPLTIFGNGRQKRAFTYISDIAPIITKSIEIKKSYNKIFNLGSDKTNTVKELAKVVKKYANQEKKIRYLPKRKEVFYAYASHNLAKRLLGYHPKISIHEGVKKMLGWLRINKDRKIKKMQVKLELKKNLPSFWLKE